MPVTAPVTSAINIKNVIDTREQLIADVLSRYKNRSLTGEDFIEFVHKLHDCMPKVSYNALYKSVQPLVGVPLGGKERSELSWRLAGNMHYLKKGLTVPPWTRQLWSEWCPMSVLKVTRRRRVYKDKKTGEEDHKRGAVLTLFILAGLPAGKTITRYFSQKGIFSPSVKPFFGFSRWDRAAYSRHYTGKHNHPLHDELQLVRMRVFGLFDPALDIKMTGEPMFDEIKSTSSTLKWNRALMEQRTRDTFECQMNYAPAAMPCYKCPLGYMACEAACHPVTYQIKPCPCCKNPQAHFDPSVPADICVACCEFKAYDQ